MLRKLKVATLGVALTLSMACASTPIQRARTVSSTVHSALAAVDDAEEVVYASGAVPQWTSARHKEFSKHLVVALKAALALNEEVRLAPVSPQAKVDLATVSSEVVILEDIATEALGTDSKVVIGLKTVDAAIVKILPLFLQ